MVGTLKRKASRDMIPTLLTGDCRGLVPEHGPFGMILADPPYGDTSLEWDRRVEGWQAVAAAALPPTASLWVFGSLRYFMAEVEAFTAAGLRYAQEIVWEKQNGSGFAADRFKRVHELAVQFVRTDAKWASVYNDVQREAYAGPRKSVRKRGRTPHTGDIGDVGYADDGTRIVRSVIAMPNRQGKAIHPTEKPVDLLEILIRTSCPPGTVLCDMFAGSGAAGEAARNAGREYVGFEIDPEMADKARDRLASKLALVTA